MNCREPLGILHPIASITGEDVITGRILPRDAGGERMEIEVADNLTRLIGVNENLLPAPF